MTTLKELVTVSTIVLAFAVVAGWTYLTSYFGAFNIELWLLDVPAYNFAPLFVVALKWQALLLVAIWIGGYFFLKEILLKRTFQWKPFTLKKKPAEEQTVFVLNAYVALVLLLAFLQTIINSNEQGKHFAQIAVKEANPVHIIFKEEHKENYDAAMVQANKDGRLFLLAQSKDLVIVFEGKDANLESTNVYVVARSDLSSVRIQVKKLSRS